CSRPVPDPRAVRPDIPAACATIVERAMAKYPAQRYATAAEMLAALEAVLASAPAPPEHKQSRRRLSLRLFYCLGAGVLLLLLGWLVFLRNGSPPEDRPSTNPALDTSAKPVLVTKPLQTVNEDWPVVALAYARDGKLLASGTCQK